ncbi:MAG: SRPBCC domain-containing protein, partial [Acidobacteria bacterium]|nr:SRPBCC domain-containing protein [Acidobacteriota bacterium]
MPAERVWAALTSPRDLGLLTLGRVEMGAQPGMAFRWQWGVWAKLAPRGRAGSAVWKGAVLDVVPGSTLVLGPAGGGAGPPVVTLTLKGERGSTLVTVVQAATESAEDYEYGWADFLLRLKTNLETESLEQEVLARTLVKGTPADVYRAWLNPK